MLYREIIAVCSLIHTKHINMICVLGVNVLNLKFNCLSTNALINAYSGHWIALYLYVRPNKTNTYLTPHRLAQLIPFYHEVHQKVCLPCSFCYALMEPGFDSRSMKHICASLGYECKLIW